MLSAAKGPTMVSGEMIGLDVDELVVTIISHIAPLICSRGASTSI